MRLECCSYTPGTVNGSIRRTFSKPGGSAESLIGEAAPNVGAWQAHLSLNRAWSCLGSRHPLYVLRTGDVLLPGGIVPDDVRMLKSLCRRRPLVTKTYLPTLR